MTRTRILLTTLAAMLALSGCAAAPNPGDKFEEDMLGGKEDRWNAANDPMRFDGEFNYHVADLPTQGTAANDSWPSTYWPTYEDSVNHRWNSGELSPAEKYDLAFNGWTPPEGFDDLRPFSRHRPGEGEWDPTYYEQLGPLARHISTTMGNGRDRALALREGGLPEGEEWPTESWWGLCHAWVPAAILEDRPLRAVEHNGVTFEVGDLEALLIAAYNRTPADMIGGRCNVGSGDTEVERDEHGRPVDVECRDSNPGAMHVIVTNYLGSMHRGFAMDRTFDYQVWNQPVVGYEITKQEEIDVARANQLLGLTGDTYVHNADAVTLYDVNLSLNWVTESHASKTPNDTGRYTRTDRLTYILEVDADGKIIGGEYYGASHSLHPDFLWNPRRLSRSSTPNLDLEEIRRLVAMSREPDMPVDPAGGLIAEGTGADIPDNDAMGIRNVASASGGEGVVASARVTLDISHSYVGDLLVSLEHGGVSYTLHNREGGSDDDLTGAFDAVGFDGLDPNGAWTLHVSDNAGQDVGRLNGWAVEIATTAGAPVEPPRPSVERYDGMGGVAIPDNDTTGITSTASVMSVPGTVEIAVALTHTYIGDLTVEVSHGDRTWRLHDREGGSDDDLNETYPLDATGNAFSGDPSGAWTLRVVDHAGQDVGTLDSWAVVVTH